MTHKEALQKIVDFKPTLKGIFIDDLIDEINSLKNIATKALQSESEYAITNTHEIGVRESENSNHISIPKSEAIYWEEHTWDIVDGKIKCICGATKENNFEHKEQPTSPFIEKMAEDYALSKNKRCVKDFHSDYGCNCYADEIAFIEGYKANNSLEELEKWVTARSGECMDSVSHLILLEKFQELKP
jgi:hypothetical protein